jgi:hypothetical protein
MKRQMVAMRNSKQVLKSIVGGVVVFSICYSVFLVHFQSGSLDRQLWKEQLLLAPMPIIKSSYYDEERDVSHSCAARSYFPDPVPTGDSSLQHFIPSAALDVIIPKVPQKTVDVYGENYPTDFGFTLEETVRNDPLRFYRHVVRTLMWDNEPKDSNEIQSINKKLLAEYKGREYVLASRLSMRYRRERSERTGKEREMRKQETKNETKKEKRYRRKEQEKTITIPSTKKEESVTRTRSDSIIDVCVIVRTYFQHAPVLVRFCLLEDEWLNYTR